MSDISTSGGIMLGFKIEIDDISTSIKAIKQELDDELEKMMMKTSSLVEINKNLSEIELAGQEILNLTKKNDVDKLKVMLKKIRRKIYDAQILMTKDVQKSMLKASQEMAEAENGILMIKSLNNLIKNINSIEEKMA